MQEVNHHETYAALVDAVGGAPLSKMLLGTTYSYVRALLASEHLKVGSCALCMVSPCSHRAFTAELSAIWRELFQAHAVCVHL